MKLLHVMVITDGLTDGIVRRHCPTCNGNYFGRLWATACCGGMSGGDEPDRVGIYQGASVLMVCLRCGQLLDAE